MMCFQQLHLVVGVGLLMLLCVLHLKMGFDSIISHLCHQVMENS
jgi:hypothetical protein